MKPARLTLSLPSALHLRSCIGHSPDPVTTTHSHPGTSHPHPKAGWSGGILTRSER